MFGRSAFGAKPGFGGAAGGFGAPPAQGGFGAPAANSFGAPAAGGFGASAQGAAGFGGAVGAPAVGGFGAPAQGVAGFGGAAAGGFGGPAQGAAVRAQNAIGQQQIGTKHVQYQAYVVGHGQGWKDAGFSYLAIPYMPQFAGKCQDELRLEDLRGFAIPRPGQLNLNGEMIIPFGKLSIQAAWSFVPSPSQCYGAPLDVPENLDDEDGGGGGFGGGDGGGFGGGGGGFGAPAAGGFGGGGGFGAPMGGMGNNQPKPAGMGGFGGGAGGGFGNPAAGGMFGGQGAAGQQCPCKGKHGGSQCYGKGSCVASPKCQIPGQHDPGSWVGVAAKEKVPCKSFERNGSCKFGARCRFSHAPANQGGFGKKPAFKNGGGGAFGQARPPTITLLKSLYEKYDADNANINILNKILNEYKDREFEMFQMLLNKYNVPVHLHSQYSGGLVGGENAAVRYNAATPEMLVGAKVSVKWVQGTYQGKVASYGSHKGECS